MCIRDSLYAKYDVKRGLRDINGKGVLTGLTEISDIISSKVVDGKTVPCEGKLYYRGIDVEELVAGFLRENRFGFAETVYLLLDVYKRQSGNRRIRISPIEVCSTAISSPSAGFSS